MFCSCLSIVKHNIHLKHSSVPLTLVKQTPSAVTQTKSRLPPGADGGRASTSHAHVLLRMPVSAFLPPHGPHPRTLPRAVPSARSARGRPAGLFSPSSLPRPPRPLPQLGALAPHAPLTHHVSPPGSPLHCSTPTVLPCRPHPGGRAPQSTGQTY